MLDLLPGILEQDFAEIEKKLEIIKPFAQSVHIDIIDGKFANNTTWLDPKPFQKYSQDIFFELHMMVEEPERYIDDWGKAGFRRFVGHIEKMGDQKSFIERATEYGQAGFALDADTPVEALKVEPEELDSILIMTIKAGFSGQTFRPELLEKVKHFKTHDMVPVEVDGGVNDQTIGQAITAGAVRFVATSALFKTPTDPHTRYRELLTIATDQARS